MALLVLLSKFLPVKWYLSREVQFYGFLMSPSLESQKNLEIQLDLVQPKLPVTYACFLELPQPWAGSARPAASQGEERKRCEQRKGRPSGKCPT